MASFTILSWSLKRSAKRSKGPILDCLSKHPVVLLQDTGIKDAAGKSAFEMDLENVQVHWPPKSFGIVTLVRKTLKSKKVASCTTDGQFLIVNVWLDGLDQPHTAIINVNARGALLLAPLINQVMVKVYFSKNMLLTGDLKASKRVRYGNRTITLGKYWCQLFSQFMLRIVNGNAKGDLQDKLKFVEGPNHEMDYAAIRVDHNQVTKMKVKPKGGFGHSPLEIKWTPYCGASSRS